MIYKLDYPTKIEWRVSLPEDGQLFSIYSSRTKKDLLNSLQKLENSDYTFEFDEVDEKYLDKFIPLYITNTETIKGGLVRDIRSIILNDPKKSGKCKSISFYDKKEYRGGIIYRITGKNIVNEIAKVFPKKIDVSLKLNVSFIAEYYLYDYAYNNNIRTVSLGVDTNIFGKRGSIGLAIYKLRTGAQPYVAKANGVTMYSSFEFNNLVDDDTLIFIGNLGDKIKSAKLFLNKSSTELDKYSALLKNSKIDVELIR